MDQKKLTLDDSPKYKSFIRDRNKALEQINLNTQTDLSRLLFETLDSITGFVSHMALSHQFGVGFLKHLTHQLDQYMDHKFEPLAAQMEGRIKRMRRATFVLTYLAELEAVARATQRTKPMSQMDFKRQIKAHEHQNTILGQQWSLRLWYLFSVLKQRILKAFHRGLLQELSPKEIVDLIKDSYPQIKAYRKPPRALKPIREADRKRPEDEGDEFDFYANLTNDEDWQLAVQSYLDTEIPPSRFDHQATYDPEASYFRYDWELEQEVTDDFVQQVRDGQIDAANDLGVKDFVWVSVIDDKTCEVCCLPRNGKTISEIESMLKSGELDEDECDATSPPAHPHCRCDIAPVGSTDEVEGPDWKSFQDWLDS